MKKTALMVCACAAIAYCQYYEGLVTTSVYGGLGLAAGSGVYPGPTLCIEPIRNVSPYFGIGGHLDYSWFWAKKPPSITEEFSMGVHMMDLALVPKAAYPISKNATLTLEVDPGLYVTYFYFMQGNTSATSVNKFFGLTEGLSLRVKPYVLCMKCKTLFAEIFRKGFDNMFSKDNTLTWFTFSVGVEI